MPLATRVIALSEKHVEFSGTYEEFRASGLNDIGDQENTEENESHKAEEKKVEVENSNKKKKAEAAKAQQEERRSGSVSLKSYWAYAQACGGVLPVLFFLATVAISEGTKNASDVWLSIWSDNGGGPGGALILLYIAIGVLFGSLLYVVSRILMGQRGSRVLHEQCVVALLRAQMKFFDQTPSGQILNRLAEDTNILDYNLPQTMAANFVWYWKALSIVAVCMTVAWYLIILLVPMFYLYSKLAKRYLPATRDLRRLDAAARSPIFSHFSETAAGVSTVRALQQGEHMTMTSINRLEAQMEAYYLSNTASRWLSLRLQVNGTVLLGAISALGIFLSCRGNIAAGLVGLAISYSLKLTETLNMLNRESADRETQMISVERVVQYKNSVESEAQLVVPGTPESWLSKGDISVQDVVMRYREGLPTVLKGISMEIKRGERVGIVGRTGCGKSSFLMMLMRVVETESGAVFIDGKNTQQVGLHDLRGKSSIIPQDPAILTGTVRFNLDPFGREDDAKLWDALEKSQLKNRVESAGGLDSEVSEGGGNYSVGELQLLCLARALLRRQEVGGLLLLDEATSALDGETDQIIQKVIRSDFHCTTITIAHRIQTLMDYDKVAVLDAGKVVEFGSPQELMKVPSQFQSLARQGGVTL